MRTCSTVSAPPRAETFRQLIKISGIGARIALAVLSGMSVAELAQAVTLQEAGRLTRIPGIGKKTAERLLLELKGKLGADLGTVPGGPAVSDDAVDVLNALLALGYSDKEAALAIKQVPAGTGVSEESSWRSRRCPRADARARQDGRMACSRLPGAVCPS